MSRDERSRNRDDEPVLPDRSRDDSDIGWGGDGERGGRTEGRDAEWYRREKPPHHGD